MMEGYAVNKKPSTRDRTFHCPGFIEMHILLTYLILINIIAFALYGIDKHRAITHKWRISERMLIGVALIGGSIGAICGMN